MVEVVCGDEKVNERVVQKDEDGVEREQKLSNFHLRIIRCDTDGDGRDIPTLYPAHLPAGSGCV